VTASQILALKRSQACFETTFRVVDDPVMAALAKHIPLGGMPAVQRVGRRIDSTFGKQLRKTLAIDRSDELNHGKDPATVIGVGSRGRPAHAAAGMTLADLRSSLEEACEPVQDE
jgi:hypothetical protein